MNNLGEKILEWPVIREANYALDRLDWSIDYLACLYVGMGLHDIDDLLREKHPHLYAKNPQLPINESKTTAKDL